MYDMPSLMQTGDVPNVKEMFLPQYSNIRWVHDTHENTYPNGGIVVILMWIYRLVTVLLCQNKLYTIHCH